MKSRLAGCLMCCIAVCAGLPVLAGAESARRPPRAGLFTEGNLLGLKWGLTPDQIVAQWGPPSASTSHRSYGLTSATMRYGLISLSFGQITPQTSLALWSISVRSRSFGTPRGLRVGDTLARARALYPHAALERGRLLFEKTPASAEGATFQAGRVANLFVGVSP